MDFLSIGEVLRIYENNKLNANASMRDDDQRVKTTWFCKTTPFICYTEAQFYIFVFKQAQIP